MITISDFAFCFLFQVFLVVSLYSGCLMIANASSARQLCRDKFWHSLKDNQKLIGSCWIDIRLLISALPSFNCAVISNAVPQMRRKEALFIKLLSKIKSCSAKSSCSLLRKINEYMFTFYSFRLMLKFVFEGENEIEICHIVNDSYFRRGK